MGGTGDNKELENGEDLKCEGEGMPLTNEHLKSRLNTRRASSIEGENEMIETQASEEKSNKDNGTLHLDVNITTDQIFAENEKMEEIRPLHKLETNAKLASVPKSCMEQIVIA